MGKFVDLTGQKFGRLVVIKKASNNKQGIVCWLCQCECGNIKIVRGDSLKQGLTLSCGCLHKNAVKNACKINFLKHGLSKTRINNIWFDMKARCYNKESINYKNYGGRGITVCNEWKNDFLAFYNWAIKNGYNDTFSIDRINVNGNYYPDNCRWVDIKTQSNNRRNNHLITYNGITHTLSEWAEIKGIKVSTLTMRLKHYGWSIEKSLES